MAISKGVKANFETLQRAADDGNLVLMECTDKKTGKVVNVICAVNVVANDPEPYQFVPIAKMFDGNPYKEVLPPTKE